MSTADAPGRATDHATEAAPPRRTDAAEGGADGTAERSRKDRGDAVFTSCFERWYGPMVGLARRILDSGSTTPASLVNAEQIAIDASACAPSPRATAPRRSRRSCAVPSTR